MAIIEKDVTGNRYIAGNRAEMFCRCTAEMFAGNKDAQRCLQATELHS